MMTRRHFLTSRPRGLAVNAMGTVPRGFTQPSGKTVRLLVGFPPGGTTDVIARLLVNEMKDYASSIMSRTGPGRVAGLPSRP